MDCIIVGGGVAGFQAAATCRMLWPEVAVTVVDAEKECGYYRTLLPQYMAGTLPEEKLFLPRREADPLLTIRTGARVKALDRKARRLRLTDGKTLTYDRLILAQGGDPYLPGPLAGPPAKGIFPVRDLTAARAARTAIRFRALDLRLGQSDVRRIERVVNPGKHSAGLDVRPIINSPSVFVRAE